MPGATKDRPQPAGPASKPVVVSLQGATKAYGPNKALTDVDMELRAGEVMCLAGENGAGKSTLIKILTGAIVRDSGDYHVDGEDIGSPSPTKAREAGIGVVYQELSLLPDLSVAENLMMSRLPNARGRHPPARAAQRGQGDARARRPRRAGSRQARRRRCRSHSSSSSRSRRCSARSRAC